ATTCDTFVESVRSLLHPASTQYRNNAIEPINNCSGYSFAGPKHPKEVRPETDPFIAGGLIGQSPEEWLRNNWWRLRGVKSADGRYVSLPTPPPSLSIEKIAAEAAEMETWRLPAAKGELLFKKTDRGYLLVDCLSVDGR
ncbi:MAG: hypothetical protein KA354_23830, partial [Phycisphaerae bacterium]|nr:hypothetical protein [Phycisphaerae bacterium]